MAAPKGNKYARGHHFGRPSKFKSAEELEEKIKAYFADCDPHIETKTIPTPVIIKGRGSNKTFWIPKKTDIPDEWRMMETKYITKQQPYTVTGLAVWLDADRDLLMRYERREAFYDTIKRAKTMIEAFWEKALWNNKVSTAGVIFNLKNNWGITKDTYDKKHQELQDKIQELEIEMSEHSKADYEYQNTVATVISVARRAKTIFDNSSEPARKRQFLNYILQNPTVNGKKLYFTIASPFNLVLELADSPNWLPIVDEFRTLYWAQIKREVGEFRVF